MEGCIGGEAVVKELSRTKRCCYPALLLGALLSAAAIGCSGLFDARPIPTERWFIYVEDDLPYAGSREMGIGGEATDTDPATKSRMRCEQDRFEQLWARVEKGTKVIANNAMNHMVTLEALTIRDRPGTLARTDFSRLRNAANEIYVKAREEQQAAALPADVDDFLGRARKEYVRRIIDGRERRQDILGTLTDIADRLQHEASLERGGLVGVLLVSDMLHYNVSENESVQEGRFNMANHDSRQAALNLVLMDNPSTPWAREIERIRSSALTTVSAGRTLVIWQVSMPHRCDGDEVVSSGTSVYWPTVYGDVAAFWKTLFNRLPTTQGGDLDAPGVKVTWSLSESDLLRLAEGQPAQR